MPDKSQTTLDMIGCRRCGHKDVEIEYNGPTPEQVQHAISWAQDYDASYFGHCPACDAVGEERPTPDEAAEAWNMGEHVKA